MQEFAGLWLRVRAFMLDYLVIAAYLILLVGVILLAANLVNPDLFATLFADPVSGEIVGFLTVTLPVLLFFALSESSPRQGTWGKQRMGVRVIRADGSRLSRGRALIRTAIKFIPWELSHACIWNIRFAQGEPSPLIAAGFILVWALVGVNIISLVVSKTRQTVYDRLAGVYVVRV